MKFIYDGDGNRVKKVQNGQTTIYIGALDEKNISAGVTATYYFAGNTPTDRRFTGQPGSIEQTLLAMYRMYLECDAETP